MSDYQRMLQAAQRQNVQLFIQGVFATLNNGDRPSGAPYLEALAFAWRRPLWRPAADS